jgi:multiple sugar transport system substrate-binding protein
MKKSVRDGTGGASIVFKHGKIGGVASEFEDILRLFEKQHPGITVKDEVLPASTDTQHQFYVINLESKSSDFDVISMDVIWVPEFARSGWLTQLDHLFAESDRDKFFSSTVKAVTYNDHVYAIPWYIDAGVMYYRKDLLDKYGFNPPDTWSELITIASTISGQESDIYGFIWQGKQYEGLVCNAMEYIWGNGGKVLKKNRAVLQSHENVHALQFMHDLIYTHKITPALVTTAIEETTRHIFGNGKAVFMRNWPYAWNIFQKNDSPVKDKVGVCALPEFKGKKSASTLGGWQLGINRFSRKKEEAEKLITFLTSPEIQKKMALTVGYKPTRLTLYSDSDIKREQPFMIMLRDILMNARARPVTPHYMALTQILQPEFSAVISGKKTPEDALIAAQKQIRNFIENE